MERREFLKRAARLSPLLIPGVAGAVISAACEDGSSKLPPESTSVPTSTPELLDSEREVIAYPKNAKPSEEIARGILSFQEVKTPIVLLRLDPRLSDEISVHVNQIVEAGYADNIDDKDFYHGHFHINDPKSCEYTSEEIVPNDPWGGHGRKPRDNFPAGLTYEDWIDRFLSSDPYFVYHTREHITGQEPVTDSDGRVTPPENDYTGPPRSILGAMDDSVYPMSNDYLSYKKYGSVSGMDVFEYGDMKSDGMCETQPYDVSVSVEGQRYTGSQMFLIIPDSTGRYSLEGGMKYDVYLQLH